MMPLLPVSIIAPAPSITTYRKTTTKTVNTTVSATDLLNGEITVAGGAMGATGNLALTAWGDYLNNTGGNVAGFRLQLLFGGTTMFDTGAGSNVSPSATRSSWWLQATIQNASASSQTVAMTMLMYAFPGLVTTQTAWTTGLGGSTMTPNGRHEVGTNTGLAVNTANAAALVLNTINGSASASSETRLFGALAVIL